MGGREGGWKDEGWVGREGGGKDGVGGRVEG